MAIDTRNKRASCISLVTNNRGHLWPNPDGSLANRSDRQFMTFLYAGVLTAVVVTYFDGLTSSMMLTGVGH